MKIGFRIKFESLCLQKYTSELAGHQNRVVLLGITLIFAVYSGWSIHQPTTMHNRISMSGRPFCRASISLWRVKSLEKSIRLYDYGNKDWKRVFYLLPIYTSLINSYFVSPSPKDSAYGKIFSPSLESIRLFNFSAPGSLLAQTMSINA